MSLPEMRKAQKIKKLFPVTNGIFAHMNFVFRAEISKTSLDALFVSNYGLRNPSPIVETIQDEYGEQLTDSELTTLAAIIVEMYGPKWNKIANIYNLQYDPIHNYLDEWEDSSEEVMDDDQTDTGTKTNAYGKTVDSTDTRTDNLTMVRDNDSTSTNTRTDNLTELETRNLGSSETRTDNLTETHTYGKTSTRTDNLTEDLDSTTTSNGSGSENNSLYGFNSNTAVNSDASATTDANTEVVDSTKHNTGTQATAETGSDGITNTGTQGTTGTETGTRTIANTGTQQNSGSGTVDETITNTGTRTNVLAEEQGGSDTTTNNLAHTDDYTLNRDRSGRHFGNIGNLTSQKQIVEEINLWRWNYMQEILNDVKEFCTLPVYLNATEYQLVDPDDD